MWLLYLHYLESTDIKFWTGEVYWRTGQVLTRKSKLIDTIRLHKALIFTDFVGQNLTSIIRRTESYQHYQKDRILPALSEGHNLTSIIRRTESYQHFQKDRVLPALSEEQSLTSIIRRTESYQHYQKDRILPASSEGQNLTIIIRRT